MGARPMVPPFRALCAILRRMSWPFFLFCRSFMESEIVSMNSA